MQIRVGYDLTYECPQPTPMVLTLHIHFTRASDLIVPDDLITRPSIPISLFRDSFGNWRSRIVAPAGEVRLSADAVLEDRGRPDPVVPSARQIPVQNLPDDVLVFLLGSRYCETDLLSEAAWNLFGQTPEGWGRVQEICDFVHDRITFNYQHARPTKTASEVFREKSGVCRDFTHLAMTLCRCMNIPARYCTGYLTDIGVTPPKDPMDFHAWFEAYLDGQWYAFDPRNNVPRIGRILIARGRDAADVPISDTFGPNILKNFRVWADEVSTGPAVRPTLGT